MGKSEVKLSNFGKGKHMMENLKSVGLFVLIVLLLPVSIIGSFLGAIGVIDTRTEITTEEWERIFKDLNPDYYGSDEFYEALEYLVEESFKPQIFEDLRREFRREAFSYG